MPLSKKALLQIQQGNKPLNTNSPSHLYDDLSGALEPHDSGNMLDFVGSALWGVTSGLTWGVSELAVPSKPWEEMNTAERSGWILGEGVSLFAPLGPFGLMAKGSRAAVKGTNKFIKEGAESAVKAGIKNVDNLSKAQARKVALALKKGVSVEDDLVKALNKAAESDIGLRWLKDLQSTGKFALDASDNLVASSMFAVKKAFKKAGVRIRPDSAERISREFVDHLQQGNYVNDIAEWVTRGLAGRIPDTAKGFLSKYLGMATQDMYMMGLHGLISGKMKSIANGEDFDIGGSLSHAALMSLGFPLIRMIPLGGKMKLTQGIKAYRDSFNKVDYNKIRAKHGDDVVKNLARVMLKGRRMDLINKSMIAESSWKVGGKQYTNGAAVLDDLHNMTGKHTVEFLDKARVSVNNMLKSKWGKEFLLDVAGSIPRMGVGIAAMNPWVLNKDAWGSMEGPELASHLFMSALMTRGRGAWGHTEQRAKFADFTPYHEVLNILGVDHSNVKEKIAFHDGMNPLEGAGLALSTDTTADQIHQIFTKRIGESGVKPKGQEYNESDHALAKQMSMIHDIINRSKDESARETRVEYLSKETLNEIVADLKSIKFEDGTTIGEIGYEASLVKLTTGPAKQALGHYKQIMRNLHSEGFGDFVSIDEAGNITGRLVKSNNYGTPMKDVDTYNEILMALNKIGEAKIIDGESRHSYEMLIKNSGIEEGQFNERVRKIIDDGMDVLGREFNDHGIKRHPIDENPLWDFISQAKTVEASERIYNMIVGTPKGSKEKSDKHLLAALDAVFMVRGSEKYSANISDYFKTIKGYHSREDGKKLTEEQKEANNNIEVQLEGLRTLFNLRKKALKGPTHKEPIGEVDQSVLTEVHDKWMEIYKTMPADWRANWSENISEMMITRMLRAQGVDRRARPLIEYGIENKLIWQGVDGNLSMTSKKAMIQDLRDTKEASEAEIKKYRKAFTKIEKVLKDVVTFVDVVPTESNVAGVETVDRSLYLKAAKLLSNETFSDIVTRVGPTLDKIARLDAGMRKKVHQTQSKLNNLLVALDPDRTTKAPKDPIKDIDEIITTLDKMVDRQKLDKESMPESAKIIDTLIIELNNLKRSVDRQTGKYSFNVQGMTKARREELAKEAKDSEFSAYEIMVDPIQRTIEKIAQKEYDGIDKLNSLMIRLQNVGTQGLPGLGLSKENTARIAEAIAAEWQGKYSELKNKGLMPISKLIEYVNKEGSFGDAANLIEGFIGRVNKAVLMEKSNPLNNDAVRYAEALEKRNNIHERHRSIKEILEEYELVDKDNNIDETFKDGIVNAPNITALHKVLKDNIRSKIYADDSLKPTQKGQKWHQFRDRDAMEIINQVMNARTLNMVSLEGVDRGGNNRSILNFEREVPHFMKPSTEYFASKQYSVFHLRGTMSSTINNKLRKGSIEILSTDIIQKHINEALRNNPDGAKEILSTFAEGNKGIKLSDLKKMVKDADKYFFYARLSPMNKILFVGTKDNLKAMQADYTKWYNEALARFSKDSGLKKAFTDAFGKLGEKANDNRSTVELKLLLPFLEHNGLSSQIDKLVTEIAGNGDSKTIAKIQMNMFKRLYLADGGTTQAVSNESVEWASKYHPDATIKSIAKEIHTRGGWNVALLKDTAGEGAEGIDSPFSIKGMVQGQLETLMNAKNTTGLLKSITKLQLDSIDNIPSLGNSVLDGAKFISENGMKLLMAQKGRYEANFVDGPNGMKTIIFSTGGQQMLGKGYMIYNPEVAKHMPAGVDILMGDSSAKTFKGMSIDGKSPVEALDLGTNKTDWYSNLTDQTSGIGEKHTMTIPINAIGVSFASKNGDGVTISPSIFDFQSKTSISEAMTWMKLKTNIEELGAAWGTMFHDGGKLAKHLYDVQMGKGNPMDRGDTGLTKLMLTAGGMPDNPLLMQAVMRTMRSETYDKIGNNVSQDGGSDNFISPNIDGKLSVPVHVDLFKNAEAPMERVSINYGGIGIDKHTMSRQIGSKKGIGRSLTGEKFIFRDSNGVDVIIRATKDGYEYSSTFYDNIASLKTHPEKGKEVKLADKTDVSKLKLSAKDKVKVEKVLNELRKAISHDTHTLLDVYSLLAGQSVSKRTGKTITTHNITKFLEKKMKLQLAAGAHAIPVLGHDKVIFRVERVLDRMNGLTEVNVHDLRAIMQRDNDGDHIYVHTRMPWNIMKDFAIENGRKSDFHMFEGREQVLNHEYIDIFGFGEGHKAGDNPSSTGFHSYAGRLEQAKMITGTVIGARSALSWLEKLGFVSGEGNALSPVLKNLTNPNGKETMHSSGWQWLDKFYDTVQNALDIHGGIHGKIATRRELEDFLFYGSTGESDKINTADGKFNKHAEFGGNIFGTGFGNNIAKSQITREIFSEVIKTLRSANSIANDVYDEAGKRAPEPEELRQTYYDIYSLFSNPTQYLSRSVASRISREKNKTLRNELLGEYIDFFYGDMRDASNIKDRSELKKMILDGVKKGYIPEGKSKFKFTNISSPSEGFDRSIQGTMLAKILSHKSFWQKNFDGLNTEGILNKDKDLYKKAGLFLSNIEHYADMSRLLGLDPIKELEKSNGDIFINSFDGQSLGDAPKKSSGAIGKALHAGVLKSVLQRQYRSVLGSLEYYRHERFTNPHKMEKIEARLARLQDAINIMDRQMARDMVIDKERDVQIFDAKLKQEGPQHYRFNTLKDHQKVAIYEIKGDVRKLETKDDQFTANDLEAESGRINFSQLKFKGIFTKKSNKFQLRKGFTYVIDKNPRTHELTSSNNIIYGNALHLITGGNQYVPEIFLGSAKLGDAYRKDLAVLRATIGIEYSGVIDAAMKQKVLKDGLFSMSKLSEVSTIKKFIEKWIGEVKSSGTEESIDVLLKSIIAPRMSFTSYAQDGAGVDKIAYKYNQHLMKSILQFSVDYAKEYGSGKFLETFVKDWENAARGDHEGPDISFYDRSIPTKYNWKKFGSMANPVRSLANNIFFASPALNKILDQLESNQSIKPQIIEVTPGGEKVMVGVKKVRTAEELLHLNEGRDCGL